MTPPRTARPSAPGNRTTVKIGRRELQLSNLDKVLYPEAGFTKGQVIDYYARIARTIVPHLKDRPVTLKRYPSGVDGPFFFEKRCPVHKPDWLHTAEIWSKGNDEYLTFCTLDEPAAVVWVANLAALELHTLLAKASAPETPTFVAFDFDPGPPAGRLEAAKVLLTVRDALDHLGLEAFPKTSGGKGVHMYVPLNTKVTYDQTKNFAESFARVLEKKNPELVTANMLKSKREGRVFMDWSQNDVHKTTVCAYSLRARSQPTVSTPITWAELEKAVKKKDPESINFTAPEVLKRVERLGDLFAPVLKMKQKLPG
ncbi:MAG TPA: non-homologous end-joining DNA ligase [Phycisphaerae bacterium]|nr:non-homologous end-joining DNA ligase [Phycisphaerae bacterium]